MSGVIYKNECYMKNCKKLFHTLQDLIVHIEREHLDFSRSNTEQLEKEQPECLPMSFVLKYSSADDPTPKCIEPPQPVNISQPILRKKSVVMKRREKEHGNKEVIPTLREVVETLNNNYIPCNFDIEYNSITSEIRVKQEEIPKEVSQLLRQKLFSMDNSYKKPFGCNMPGCHKRYKNINGIKYHYKTHHKFRHIPVFKKSVLKYKPSPSPQQIPQAVSKLKMDRLAAGSAPSFKNKTNENVFTPISSLMQYNASKSNFNIDQCYNRTPTTLPLTALTTNNCVLNSCFNFGSDADELTENCFSFSFSEFGE